MITTSVFRKRLLSSCSVLLRLSYVVRKLLIMQINIPKVHMQSDMRSKRSPFESFDGDGNLSHLVINCEP